ncbi:MAG: helix-turn-helix transcriptional regulator [Gemmatimonadales bacterium]
MPTAPQATPTIAAVLDPQERTRVDAASGGSFSLVHRESVRDAIRVVRERPVDAMLVSVRRCSGDAPALLEQFTRAFPAIPTVALVMQREPGDAEALLRLGATGVRQVVDATDPSGWRRLREVLGAPPAERALSVLVPVLTALGPLSSGSRRFWEELVRSAPETTTVRKLARRLAITPSTFVSRFVRAGLPSPKDHLVAVRLCHAARLFDEGDLTVADVAYRLEYASPQSFGRHLRVVLGITPSEFRSRYPFCVVLDRFLDRMVKPHVEVWRTFKPLAPGRG